MFARKNGIRSIVVATLNAALLVCGAHAQGKHLTARDVIARIQQQGGVPWQSDTVDTFKAGNPDALVSGIAVTMMATLDVLQRAAAAGDNLIITHEPTFFDHLDISDQLPEKDTDPVLAAKRQFIAEHGLVIWRFHDHWHARNPDGIEAGMVHALGWEKIQDANNQYLFTIPETPLEKLAAEIKRKLGIRIVRVVGDPGLRITKLAFAPGAAGLTTGQSPGNAGGAGSCHRRSPGMGGGRIRRGRSQRRQAKITDHSRPHSFRTSRNGRVYELAEDIRDGSSNPVRSGP